jgi:nitrite reductase/ring-hydroxylating ferredoxin subunit
MAFQKVGEARLLPPGSALHVRMGDDAVAVCNVQGTLYAIDGVCPHAGGPLGHGALEGHTLACPFHAWEFDCRTGECTMRASLKQATYAVKVEGGDIYVDVPASFK